jgi:hypothetical protein
MKQGSKPLNLDEFVHILLELVAIPKGDEKTIKVQTPTSFLHEICSLILSFKDWYDKLPINKKRVLLLTPPEEDEDKKGGAKGKPKKATPKQK